MFLFHKIGRFLRGKATPFQIIAGCLLGAWIGFMPGFAHAPGLIVVLSLALLVLNANLFLATIVGLAAKLLSLATLPVAFAAGRLLLDGPTQGFFRALINAPGTALLGFESYVATGGLVVGGAFGLVVGILVVRALAAFRCQMAALGDNSPRFREFTQKRWARIGALVFAGGLKTPDYAALLAQPKVGNPIRILGVVAVVLLVALGAIASQFFASAIITAQLRSGFEQANGATVDLDNAQLELKAGRMTLTGIAAADPNALATDLFRALRIEADVSGVNLLRKRLQLDRVVVAGATSGETRRVPGRRLRPATAPEKTVASADTKGLGDYLQNAQVWRERLAQAKQWLDKVSGPAAPARGTTPSAGESLSARLQRLAAEQGYASVQATHLIEGAPTFLITELLAADIRVAQLPGETLAVSARNLSTQPSLAGGAPEIEVTSASDRVGFTAKFSGLSAAGGANVVAFHFRGLPVDSVMSSLKTSGGAVLSGGTIDLAATGRYFPESGTINLPLEATLNETVVTIGGRPTKVAHFTLPIALSGSLSSPKITVDAKSLGNLVLQAGTDALKAKATEKLQDALGGKAGDLLKTLGGGKK
jgi:hypothetical protein